MPPSNKKGKQKQRARSHSEHDHENSDGGAGGQAPQFSLTLDTWVDGEQKTEVLTELDRWLVHTAHIFTVSVGGVSVEVGQRPDAISGSKVCVSVRVCVCATHYFRPCC